MSINDWFGIIFLMMIYNSVLVFWQGFRIFKLEQRLGIRDSRGHLVKTAPDGLD